MTLTKQNYRNISTNPRVISLVGKLLDQGQVLIVSNQPVGRYVCSCDGGTVQRIGGK